MLNRDASRPNRITNIVATVVAIAGAIVASPAALEKLPDSVVQVLRVTATLGNTTHPMAVTIAGVLIAAITHPPEWILRWIRSWIRNRGNQMLA